MRRRSRKSGAPPRRWSQPAPIGSTLDWGWSTNHQNQRPHELRKDEWVSAATLRKQCDAGMEFAAQSLEFGQHLVRQWEPTQVLEVGVECLHREVQLLELLDRG